MLLPGPPIAFVRNGTGLFTRDKLTRDKLLRSIEVNLTIAKEYLKLFITMNLIGYDY
jgi:hypothetical protein